jgi:hypothetical protein
LDSLAGLKGDFFPFLIYAFAETKVRFPGKQRSYVILCPEQIGLNDDPDLRIFFVERAKDIDGVGCARRIFHVHTDKRPVPCGDFEDFPDIVDTEGLVKFQAKGCEFDRKIGIEFFAGDGMEDFIGAVARGDRFFPGGDILSQNIKCGAHTFLVELPDRPNRVLDCLTGDVSPREISDDRFRDGRKRCYDEFIQKTHDVSSFIERRSRLMSSAQNAA